MCTSSKPSAPAVVIPKAEPLPAQPAAVQEPDAATSAARDNERKRRLRAASSNNTLVTGGAGVQGDANTGGKQLFGV